jgi:rod shape-determining protein MreD
MKKKFLYLLVIVVALIIQTSVVPLAASGRSALDAVLMLVLAWSIIDGFNAFLPWAIMAGILYDIIAFTPIGIHVLIFLFVVYMVSFFSKRMSVEAKGTGFVIIILFVVVSIFISQSVNGIASYGRLPSVGEFWSIFISIKWFLFQVVYDCFVFAIWFIFLRWMKKYFSLEV